MSRAFDSSGGADSITFSVGTSPPDQGPITVAVLAKAASVAGFTMWMVRGLKAGTPVWGFLTSNNAGPKLFAENDFGNGVSGLSTSWRWYVMTKAAGAAIPRFHVWDLSSAWSHTDNSATVGDGTGPIDTLYVGSATGSANGWRGSIAVVATDTAAWTDGQIEARCTLAASDLFGASPDWMIRLNQASTATSVTDDTGGGGDQSAISGTTVDADDPPGFSYALTSGPAEGSAAFTLGLTTAVSGAVTTSGSTALTLGLTTAASGAVTAQGSADVPLALTVAAGPGIGDPVSTGSAAFNLGLSMAGAGSAPATGARAGGWGSLYGVLNAQRADTEVFQEYLRNPTYCPIHFVPLDQNAAGDLHCTPGGHLVPRG